MLCSVKSVQSLFKVLFGSVCVCTDELYRQNRGNEAETVEWMEKKHIVTLLMLSVRCCVIYLTRVNTLLKH